MTGNFNAGLWFMAGLLIIGALVLAYIPMGGVQAATKIDCDKPVGRRPFWQ